MTFNKILDTVCFWGIMVCVIVLSLLFHPVISGGLVNYHELPEGGGWLLLSIPAITVLHGLFYKSDRSDTPASVEEIIFFYLKICGIVALVQFGAWHGNVSSWVFIKTTAHSCFAICLYVLVSVALGEMINWLMKKKTKTKYSDASKERALAR